MAMDMHPDLHRDDPLAEKRITALNMIMSVLKDDVERMVYDVAMGFIDYDEGMENVTYKEIKWHTKRYYTVWM
jgi:DnaJ-class molecular chaperone